MREQLYDVGEIADLFQVKRKHTRDVITKKPDFPKPFIRESQKICLWLKSDVMEYFQKSYKKRKTSRSNIAKDA